MSKTPIEAKGEFAITLKDEEGNSRAFKLRVTFAAFKRIEKRLGTAMTIAMQKFSTTNATLDELSGIFFEMAVAGGEKDLDVEECAEYLFASGYLRVAKQILVPLVTAMNAGTTEVAASGEAEAGTPAQ